MECVVREARRRAHAESQHQHARAAKPLSSAASSATHTQHKPRVIGQNGSRNLKRKVGDGHRIRCNRKSTNLQRRRE
jgi:hypothetical protein